MFSDNSLSSIRVASLPELFGRNPRKNYFQLCGYWIPSEFPASSGDSKLLLEGLGAGVFLPVNAARSRDVAWIRCWSPALLNTFPVALQFVMKG